MLDFDSHYALRRQLAADLERDLVGPSGAEHEVLADMPADAYRIGVLHPQAEPSATAVVDARAEQLGTEVDLPGDDAEVGAHPEPTVVDDTRFPSTLGVTCSVDGRRCAVLRVTARAAKYVPADAEGVPMSDQQARALSRSELFEQREWARVPIELPVVEIDVSKVGVTERPLDEGLALWWHVRAPGADGEVALTVTLINRLEARSPVKDLDARFQCGLSLEDLNQDAVFVERRVPSLGQVSDDDLRSYELLYRHAKTFAVGHGCAARWEGPGLDRKTRVESSVVPQARVRVATHRSVDNPTLDMKAAAAMAPGDVVAGLAAFIDGYEGWIGDTRSAATELPESLRAVAAEHLALCEESVGRMRAGIEQIEKDPDVRLAFQLMQEAMTSQRAASVLRAGGKLGTPDAGEVAAGWRPFQLGFILQCLEGIADHDSPDREVADLLWFPTGGGKTEAYLGLIAFTVFLRRLRGEGAGVTVLMRYTLRLLTVQQFARATLLICSCERIRRLRDDLGEAEISIGLWVGQGGTPNTMKQAEAALGGDLRQGNPRQLEACPWCGHAFTPRNYRIADGRVLVACEQNGCEFRNGLPVHLVDESIYEVRPTLLIATEDKFAAIAWRDECRNLFNLGTDDAPPALIVQDELHLISGPLGTIAGLYEMAVDLLCEAEGPLPKVIASTATIRRADSQTRGLFGREMRQFPPPGIDARDSYFAVEADPKVGADRLYVGLLSPVSSHAYLMIRVFARLLHSASSAGDDDGVRDAYWTLVGYFNSLRVLGGAVLQVHDDVRDRLQQLSDAPDARGVVEELDLIEMTSRVPSERIPKMLKELERPLGREPKDVVLATNMISVGLDVDRLGLMAVMGQPQATSEYIQATSRVGRKWPGLVAVIFNGNKSRDRSHYENFAGYHHALYRHVEATSVTPLSPRARDRALHAILIALARQTLEQFGGNEGAGMAERARPKLEAVRDRIMERAERTLPSDSPDRFEMLEAVRAHLDAIIERWETRARRTPGLVYQASDSKDSLLTSASGAQSKAFATGYSMRDVDAETTFEVVNR